MKSPETAYFVSVVASTILLPKLLTNGNHHRFLWRYSLRCWCINEYLLNLKFLKKLYHPLRDKRLEAVTPATVDVDVQVNYSARPRPFPASGLHARHKFSFSLCRMRTRFSLPYFEICLSSHNCVKNSFFIGKPILQGLDEVYNLRRNENFFTFLTIFEIDYIIAKNRDVTIKCMRICIQMEPYISGTRAVNPFCSPNFAHGVG